MKHWISKFMIVVMAMMLCGCGRTDVKKEGSESTQEETAETLSQGKESWWLKRREGNQPPEVSDHVDLSKYDAYYIDPKVSKKKKCIYLTFDCGYENGFTPKILDILKKQKATAAFL